jgi:hypothetical protein
MRDILSGLNASTVRMLDKNLAAAAEQSKLGAGVAVTKGGKVHGHWTPARSKGRRIPDIPKRLARHPYTDEQGAASIKAMLDDL